MSSRLAILLLCSNCFFHSMCSADEIAKVGAESTEKAFEGTRTPKDAKGKKYVSIGCVESLEQYSAWLAMKYNLISSRKICTPTITSNGPLSGDSKVKITISGNQSGVAPLEFEYGSDDQHPCDNTKPQNFTINGEKYTLLIGENFSRVLMKEQDLPKGDNPF